MLTRQLRAGGAPTKKRAHTSCGRSAAATRSSPPTLHHTAGVSWAAATPAQTPTATAAPFQQQQQQSQPDKAPISLNLTKRQLLNFSCACCLSFQAQQQRPAGADSGHFAYSGAEGPSHWPGTCSSGSQQSPINLALQQIGCDSRLPPEFRYQPNNSVTVKNTGTTLQVNFQPGSNNISWGGQQLELLQYHFHTPSEHTLEGARSSMEAHLVHRNTKTGGFTVLAVLLEAAPVAQQPDPNPCLAAGLDAVPATAGQSAPCATQVDPTDLLPFKPTAEQQQQQQRGYVAYRGSLTTPPCSEGVDWLVWTQPLVLPQQQVEQFRAFVGGNNARPVQQLNVRTVLANCIGTA